MSQAYLDRHMKVMHSDDSLICNDCGVVKDTKKKMAERSQMVASSMCLSQVWKIVSL